MRVHYATYNPALRLALTAIDAALAWRFGSRRTPAAVPPSPSRILVCNQAHLGDVVLATAVLPALHAAYPQAEIGFLVHPGSRPVVDAHPQIRWVHSVEHWHLNRADGAALQRIRRHRKSTTEALHAIRAVGYELAIDLHPFFPNSIPLLRRSGIACLIGWNSAGFGSWLDHAACDDGRMTNILDRHARILQLMGVRCDAASLRPQLHPGDDARRRWGERVRQYEIGDSYIAVHIGAHAEHRRWPPSQWAEVIAALVRHGHRVVMLGHGVQEEALGREIARKCPAVVDLCGKLSWAELVVAIAACRLLLSHDSVAAHLAAAFDRPRICIATGIHDLRLWLRASELNIVLSKPVACAPCGRITGCATMDCIRGIADTTVVDAALHLLEQTEAGAGRPDSLVCP